MPSPSWRDNDRPNLLARKIFNFFKIINPVDIRDGKLRFPPKFVRKYGKNLSNHVLLKVPSGSLWKVELMKCESGVWLQNGWQEFSKYYSISQGHFLIFEYEGFSQFLVIICDMTASEIEYPFNNGHHEDPDIAVELGIQMEEVENDSSVEILDEFSVCQTTHCEESIFAEVLKGPKTEEIRDDSSVEILDDFPTWQKTLGKPPSQFPCSQRMKTEPPSETENASDLQKSVLKFQWKGLEFNGMKLAGSKRYLDGHHATHDLSGVHTYLKEEGSGSKDIEWRSPQPKCPEWSQPVNAKEKLTALQRANAFKPKNPFIILTISPCYVRRHSLFIPLSFAKRVFTKMSGEAILQVSDGRTWSMKYNIQSRALLNSGWKAFVQDNHLKAGDVCVFEQVRSLDDSLKVDIFRAVEDGANCFPPSQKL